MSRTTILTLAAAVIGLAAPAAAAPRKPLPNHTNIKQVPKDQYVVSYVQNGVIFAATPRTPIQFHGFVFGHHGIWLWNTGAIRGGTLIRDGEQGSIAIKALTTVFFYPNGRVHKLSFPTDTKIDGVLCAARKPVELHESSRLKQCTLAKTQRIRGHIYKAQLVVGLGPRGTVLSAKPARPRK